MNVVDRSIRKTTRGIVFPFLFVFLISSIAAAQSTYAKKIKGAKPSGIIGTSDGGNVLLFDGVLVRKVDASGKKVWQRALNLEEPERYFYVRGIAELSDGGYILTGYKNVSSGVLLGVEAWLIKLTSSGRVDWKKQFVENRFVTALSSVVSSADGGFFAAGQRGPDLFSGSSGKGGVFVASFDSSGEMRWGKAFSGDFRFNIYFYPQLFVTSAQELIVVSRLLSSQGEQLGTLVLKLDADGNLLWKKLLKKKDLKFTSGAVTADGGCVFLFSSNLSGVFSIRLNTDGDVLWMKAFRVDSQSSEGYSLAQNSDGGFTMAGEVFYASGGIFIAKLNSAGKVVFSVSSDAISVSYQGLFLAASDTGDVLIGRSVFGSSEDAFFLKLDSNANLPGCNLFSAVTTERGKFGKLKTSNPVLTTSDWTPQVRTLDIRSKKVKLTSSQFCP